MVVMKHQSSSYLINEYWIRKNEKKDLKNNRIPVKFKGTLLVQYISESSCTRSLQAINNKVDVPDVYNYIYIYMYVCMYV